MATYVKNTTEEVVGETKSSMTEKRTRWWDEEIQRMVAMKRKKFKLRQKSREREQRIKYKSLCEKTKSG